ncbi:MAG TPA: hypothetical protein DIT64_22490 [Verrucomicrobiales bacterium]|nr:hypothetical protein [Verrucomicrobiales bacterium]
MTSSNKPSIEIPGHLLASSRPGYDSGRNHPVSRDAVESWINVAREAGAASILCLLDERHLVLYEEALPGGLLAHYEQSGFDVGHLPIRDHEWPPVTEDELRQAQAWFEKLPKPVLVHCSAGQDRTGAVVEHLCALHGNQAKPSTDTLASR